MKKLILGGIGIALVIIVVGTFLILTFYPKSNSSIVNTYPALKSDYLKYNFSNIEDLSNIEQDELYYANKSVYCTEGNIAKVITYNSNSPQDKNLDGGWGRTEIIDCEDYYYIAVSGDAFPTKFYGPFDRRILPLKS